MNTERITVAIAEDEPSVREALADLVTDEPSLDLAWTARDADEAIELARTDRPDVLLCDVKMPGGGGPRATREILAFAPHTRVLALSAYEDRATVMDMIRAGAVGYLVKGLAAHEILDGLHNAAAGRSQLSMNVATHVIGELNDVLDRSDRLAAELQRIGQTREELLQTLSHELLTPTTVIQGMGKTLADHGDELSGDDLEALTTGVIRATARLRRLVENVSLAARLDEGDGSVASRPVAVGDLLSLLQPLGTDRLLIRSQDGGPHTILVDPSIASRALVAVVENALELSDGLVEVDVRPGSGTVEIVVSDRGPGVPPELATMIFEPFVQGDGSHTRAHQGVGVGLYLARRVLEAHAGSIRVEPRAGGGSSFVLSFPVADSEGLLR